MLQHSHEIPVHQYAAHEGLEAEETGEDIVYMGKVIRIAQDHYTTDNPLQEDGDPASFLHEIAAMEPIAGAKMERYEVTDMETGDILVMWRVPCRKKAGGDIPPS